MITDTIATTFGVLYYTGYNRGTISRDAAIEYNRRVTNLADAYEIDKEPLVFDPTDPILVEMFKDKTWNTNGGRLGHGLRLAWYDIKYRKYLRFKEYDGAQTTPYILFDLYLIDESKRILGDSTIDDATKLNQLTALYNTPLPRLCM